MRRISGFMAPGKCAQALALLFLCAQPASASSPDLLSRLQNIPALSGYEDSLRAVLISELPGWCRPEGDALGSLVVDLGGTGPIRLIAAPMDEPGYVISGIDTTGYLRVSRLAGAGRLFDQFQVGQRFQVLTRQGPLPAVCAAPSTHLRLRTPAGAEPWTVQDLWLDAGFHSPSEASRAGIRVLDPITLVERYTPLGGSRSAGPGIEGRAEVGALVLALQGARPAVQGHWIAAFTAQAQPGGRGLRRLIRRLNPSAVYLLGGFPRGDLGRGAAVQADSLKGLAADLSQRLLKLGAKDVRRQGPSSSPDQAGLDVLARIPAAIFGLPVRYDHTPAEMVDQGDMTTLALLIRRLLEAP